MKMIVAVIRPERLDKVLAELYKTEVNLVTVSEVMGHGRQQMEEAAAAGAKARKKDKLLKKARLEVAVNENFVEKTIRAIVRGGGTGEVGDGKVFILPLEECVRIRTQERGNIAIG